MLRKEQTKDVDIRDGVKAALPRRDPFRHAGVGSGADFVVGGKGTDPF
jgi:hypothetical protein